MQAESTAAATVARPPGTWRDYLALARPGQWIKHVFILPGIVLAMLLHERGPAGLVQPLALGLLAAACIASANYVLNEWLDARFDVFHPLKSARPAVAKRLSRPLVVLEYLVLAAAGLALGAAVSVLYAASCLLFLASAWAYNVAPVRLKDRAYLDVVTESFNNPIRLTLGWAMVDSTTLPPGSLLAAYWMGGAFLMAVKRLAEYRAVAGSGEAGALASYRRSFRAYSEVSLLVSAFVYSQLAAFFLAVFLVKYRIEYLLAVPFCAALFGAYLALGLREQSAAQTPEKLYRERRLLLIVTLLVAVLAVLTVVDVPALQRLTDPHYIRLPLG